MENSVSRRRAVTQCSLEIHPISSSTASWRGWFAQRCQILRSKLAETSARLDGIDYTFQPAISPTPITQTAPRGTRFTGLLFIFRGNNSMLRRNVKHRETQKCKRRSNGKQSAECFIRNRPFRRRPGQNFAGKDFKRTFPIVFWLKLNIHLWLEPICSCNENFF